MNTTQNTASDLDEPGFADAVKYLRFIQETQGIELEPEDIDNAMNAYELEGDTVKNALISMFSA